MQDGGSAVLRYRIEWDTADDFRSLAATTSGLEPGRPAPSGVEVIDMASLAGQTPPYTYTIQQLNTASASPSSITNGTVLFARVCAENSVTFDSNKQWLPPTYNGAPALRWLDNRNWATAESVETAF